MQMILFKMKQQFYLIAADTVEEVIDTVRITKVPLAPHWIKGLINLRGSVLTVTGLAELLEIEAPAENMNILIMKNQEERKGLLIEEVIKVVDVTPEDIQLGDASKGKYYAGMVAVKDDVANIVDVKQLIF
ncbi:chemotaxis protein CheW [Liquorilactobacillus satsumensis]|nr:chemotaxis protein CheW [Liquorilactobacillus satsumensis]AJA34289.1 purine-binding chemotaxis protein CheW [Liquorilactobacillus satsumensis]MCC7666618.1 chemotaxis protein CheW [Liquorilactobacillus satsumensis]MCP9312851.1 chemotaxis protein CheW [Liquorilactobacillus satsumensis]MCP9329260.1 chemotaxis protein CheW [Liquorilactobacillus satsumensis]MCP9357821.1 chemotaxis protein CheW [Liquorilactobacillus satsumensis]